MMLLVHLCHTWEICTERGFGGLGVCWDDDSGPFLFMG